MKICKRGHLQIEANVIVGRTGKRRCRVCALYRTNQYRETHKQHVSASRKLQPCRSSEAQRESVLKYKYGIDLKEYNRMWAEQNGLCAICGRPQAGEQVLSVDHDHETEQIRQLLCNSCNTGLGHFHEDKNLFLKAVQYLEKWGK
jgi:hypothetical protein